MKNGKPNFGRNFKMANEKVKKLESLKAEVERLQREKENTIESIKKDFQEKTVVFIDMVDSTQFKTEHADESDVWILRLFQFSNIVASAIQGCKGIVVKYIGDEVMGVFENVNDAKNLIGRISEIENNLLEITGFETRIKITVDYGPVYMMNFDGHISPDPQGLTVDRCARIAKYNQKSCVLTSVNFKDVSSDMHWCNLGKVRLKGIGEEYIYQLEKQTIILEEKIEISKSEYDAKNKLLEQYKKALEEKRPEEVKKIENSDEYDAVEDLIGEINKLIEDAGVDSSYYARFIFLYESTDGWEKYNSYEGKVFNSLIDSGLVRVSDENDDFYILNVEKKRNSKILQKLDELQELMNSLELDEDLYDMSITDADFWKNKIGYDVIR